VRRKAPKSMTAAKLWPRNQESHNAAVSVISLVTCVSSRHLEPSHGRVPAKVYQSGAVSDLIAMTVTLKTKSPNLGGAGVAAPFPTGVGCDMDTGREATVVQKRPPI